MRDQTRFLLILAITLLTLFSVQAQISSRPETGIIKDMSRTGHGVLTIHNNWHMDSEVLLADPQDNPLMAVYIRSDDLFNVTGIGDGEYKLYFTVGLWDEQAGKFQKMSGYNRYKPPLIFETKETLDEIEYSIFELDLTEAANFMPDQFEFTKPITSASIGSTASGLPPTGLSGTPTPTNPPSSVALGLYTQPAFAGSTAAVSNSRGVLSPQLWISSNSGWSEYAQCTPGARLQQMMYLPRPGNLKSYEIYPSGDINWEDYGQHPAGNFYPKFYADTPGRHILYIKIDNEESNRVTVDVV